MSDIRITDLPVLTSPDDADILHAVDTSTDRDSKLSLNDLTSKLGTAFAPTAHQHSSGQVTDFDAATRAQAEAALVAGSNITITPSGAGATRLLTITSTAGGGGTVTAVTGNAPITSSGGTAPAISITAATTSAPGSMSAADKTKLDTLTAGANGTVTGVTGTAPIVSSGGAAPAISINPASGSAPGSMSVADFTKLAGVASNATANSTDAQLRDRATHTGTQLAATVSDFNTTSRAQTEAMLTAGTNVTLTPSGSGATRSISIAATGSGGATNLDGLTDVTITSPTTDQTLIRDSAGQFRNQPLPAPARAEYYLWKTAAQSTDPGAGGIGVNNDIWESSTAIHVNQAALDGTLMTSWYSSFKKGMTFLIQNRSNPTSYIAGFLTGAPTSFTGYVTIPVEITESNGGEPTTDTPVVFQMGREADLNGLSDVTITTPASDQVLKYNGSVWVNAAAPGGGGGTVTQVLGGAGLTGDVTTTGSLAVGAGTGISVAADAVAVDRTVVDTWYATAAQGTLAGTAVQSVVGTLPITATGTTTRTVGINAATPSLPGSMSAADKTKLDAITGTNTGDNAPNSLYSGLVSNATHTGDATGATALTLATVNSNVGAFGSATQVATFTVNAKGLTTAAANVTVTPAIGSVTGLGTGVGAALAINTGAAGAFGVLIGRGTATLGVAAIASGANATVVTVAAAGVATTDVIDWGFNTNPNAVTGYNAASTAGCLVITAYPSAGNVNFVISNPTAASITPGALTLNWRVAR